MSTTDHRNAFYQSYDQAAQVVAAVTPADLARATPCPGWDVATLVSHMVGAAGRAAALGRGEQPVNEEFPSLELDKAAAALRRLAGEARAAWSESTALTRTVTMPWGETYDGSTLVDMYLTELAAHSWDLAVSTSGTGVLADDLAGPALEAARSMLKPEYRDAMGPGSPYGAEVGAPADATPWEAFAAFTGRTPRPAH